MHSYIDVKGSLCQEYFRGRFFVLWNSKTILLNISLMGVACNFLFSIQGNHLSVATACAEMLHSHWSRTSIEEFVMYTGGYLISCCLWEENTASLMFYCQQARFKPIVRLTRPNWPNTPTRPQNGALCSCWQQQIRLFWCKLTFSIDVFDLVIGIMKSVCLNVYISFIHLYVCQITHNWLP